MDFIFTVCDDAAGEAARLAGPSDDSALGHPGSGRRDGTEAEVALAFDDAYRMLNRRIGLFIALPIAVPRRLALSRLKEIGRLEGAPPTAPRRP